MVGLMRLAPPISMQPGKEGQRFVFMQPAEEEMYVGILRCDKVSSRLA